MRGPEILDLCEQVVHLAYNANMPSTTHLIGRIFGRWTVLRFATANGGTRWICQCECGKEKAVLASSLYSGKSQSCGCLRREQLAKRLTTHGASGTPEYVVWTNMKRRCTDPGNIEWHRYGGRGITYDQRWESFTDFISDMGPRPSPRHSIERIDQDGHYTSENCCWATQKQQMRNTSRNKLLTFRGETLSVAEWAERLGMPVGGLWGRLRIGWPVEQALSEPWKPLSTLTEDDVREIRELREQGASNADLAQRFGISQPAVSKIVNRRSWRHVE